MKLLSCKLHDSVRLSPKLHNNVQPLLDETHLAAVRGLIHNKVSPKCVTRRAELRVVVKTVRSKDLLNHNVKT